jgi:hypothetical protein
VLRVGFVIMRGTCNNLLISLSCIGSVSAAAFAAEQYFDRIRVFERRETAGGTWYELPFLFKNLA